MPHAYRFTFLFRAAYLGLCFAVTLGAASAYDAPYTNNGNNYNNGNNFNTGNNFNNGNNFNTPNTGNNQGGRAQARQQQQQQQAADKAKADAQKLLDEAKKLQDKAKTDAEKAAGDKKKKKAKKKVVDPDAKTETAKIDAEELDFIEMNTGFVIPGKIHKEMDDYVV